MSITTDVTTHYRERVRAALADLPATELEEVVEDVSSHLDEVSREPGVSTPDALQARLGTPEAYAATLRQAAGYPEARQPRTGEGWANAALMLGLVSTLLLPGLSALTVADHVPSSGDVLGVAVLGLLPAAVGMVCLRWTGLAQVCRTPAFMWGRRKLATLRSTVPTWLVAEAGTAQALFWAARGALLGLAAYYYALGGGDFVTNWSLETIMWPALGGIVCSIALGRLSQRDRRWLWLLVPINALIVQVLFVLAVEGTSVWTGGSVTVVLDSRW